MGRKSAKSISASLVSEDYNTRAMVDFTTLNGEEHRNMTEIMEYVKSRMANMERTVKRNV